MDVAPVLGACSGGSWTTLMVRLTNVGSVPIEGLLETYTVQSWSREVPWRSQAPFSVPGNGRAVLEIPAPSGAQFPSPIELLARDATGAELASSSVAGRGELAPCLFDLNPTSRVRASLGGVLLPIAYRSRSGATQLAIEVGSPESSPVSGELLLPERPIGYAGATLVLADSAVLARLPEPALAALTEWVLTGGSLAITISRPEDLSGALMTKLVGGAPVPVDPPPSLRKERLFRLVPEGASSSYGSAVPLIERKLRPSEAVADTLMGYSGGNLRATPVGASASYGLGEVHLLAWNPSRSPALEDAWAQQTLAELVRTAWNRQASVAFPLGVSVNEYAPLDEIRKQLDPSESSRWVIGAATLLLLLYAVLAGPLNFHLAKRAQRPLRAWLVLPVLSLLTLLSIVALGLIAKGVRGQARQLAFIELGAGVPTGSITRYRGFFAPTATELSVRGRARQALLEVADNEEDSPRLFVLDREGPRLEGLRAKPWKLLMVKEHGTVSLGAGVGLYAVGGKLHVKNRLGRDLVGVVVSDGSGNAFHLERLVDGSDVAVSSGKPLSVAWGTGLVQDLDVSSFHDELNRADANLSDAWSALAGLSASQTYWWPDVPVLIGQVAGGEGSASDTGFELRQDRVLVRVVGWGGEP
jgi:hypothetical protein